MSQAWQFEEDRIGVLILPFKKRATCPDSDRNLSLEESLQGNLRNRIWTDKLAYFDVRYEPQEPHPAHPDSSQKIAKKYNADLVIWGEYAEDCDHERSSAYIYYTLAYQKTNLGKPVYFELIPIRSIVFDNELPNDVNFLIHFLIAMSYYNRNQRNQNDLNYATTYFEKAASFSKNQLLLARAYYYLGNILVLEEKPEPRKKAIKDFYDKAISLDSTFVAAYISRGYTFGLLGETYLRNSDQKSRKIAIEYFNKSIENYRQVLKLTSDSSIVSIAYNNRAFVYIHSKNYEKALADCDSALAFRSGCGYDSLQLYYCVQIFINFSVAYVGLGKYDSALVYCRKASNLNPDATEPYNNCAVANIKKGEYQKALECLDDGLKYKTNHTILNYNKACVYCMMHNKEEAFQSLKKALHLDSLQKIITNDEVLRDRDLECIITNSSFKKLLKNRTPK